MKRTAPLHFISPPPTSTIINQKYKKERRGNRERTGEATLFVCVFLLTDATETHLFVIWAIADMFYVCGVDKNVFGCGI
jgi:hypothetical protein